MINIDQQDDSALRHAGMITARPPASFGDREYGSAPTYFNGATVHDGPSYMMGHPINSSGHPPTLCSFIPSPANNEISIARAALYRRALGPVCHEQFPRRVKGMVKSDRLRDRDEMD
jgi:hypothetical protein